MTLLKNHYKYIQIYSALSFYILFNILINFTLTSLINNMLILTLLFSFIVIIAFYLYESSLKTLNFNCNYEKIKNTVTVEFKVIFKELLLFIPILIIFELVIYSFMTKEPQNNLVAKEMFNEHSISFFILAIILAPIYEEWIYRYIPRLFISNSILYVIISSAVFAGIHIIHYPHPEYYFCFYMLNSLYWSYRYYITNDIWSVIAMHSFNNLINILLI